MKSKWDLLVALAGVAVLFLVMAAINGAVAGIVGAGIGAVVALVVGADPQQYARAGGALLGIVIMALYLFAVGVRTAEKVREGLNR